MGGWLTGLGAGAQGILGQRAANQEAGFKAQNFALDQATTRIQQQNALLEQQKFEQATKDAQAKQAAMEAIRQKNIQVPVGNGQTMNLADMFALNMGPKDFAPPADKLTYKTTMVDGKPHRWSRNESVPNSPWKDEGEAPPAATGDVMGTFMKTPLAKLPIAAVDKDGNAIGDPFATPSDVKASPDFGGFLTQKNADLLAKNKSTIGQLDQILDLGAGILPEKEPTSRSEYASDMAQALYRSHFDQEYKANYSAFGETTAAIIPYMRGLTGTSRPNQQEYSQAVERIKNAKTFPALEAAVNKAKDLLRAEQQGYMKTGRIDVSGSAPSGGGGDGWFEVPGARDPDGRPVRMRHNGSQWQKMDASGAWVPVNG